MDDHKLDKRSLLKLSGAGLALTAIQAEPADARRRARAKAKAATAGAPVEHALTGPWQFKQSDTTEWLPATVPGTVHTDLLAAKKIEDPFYRTNERDQQWIDKKDWEYRTTFAVDAATLGHDHVELVFAGLDTYAEVYVNDTLVLSADNMFRTWTADVKAHLKPGANALRILFRSAINEGLKKLAAFGYNPPATNDQSENGGLGDKKVSIFTRKAGYHYGWDWGPRFVTSGVWRPVTLRAWNTARIDDLHIVQDSLTPELASLTAVFTVIADTAGPATLEITSPNDTGLHARADVQLTAGLNTVPLTLSIVRPNLWWSNGLGEAFLYTLSGKLTAGKSSDRRDVKTGLRTLKIVRQPDDAGTSFYVELNGMPVFMKGANYIPNDSFLPRVTHDVHDRVIQSAVDTHMNMLRVWGGGIYEEDYFYDQCDANGILIWHDFMFACSMYPGDAAFLDNIRIETEQNVRRLRNHPCIALWVGNNEIDAAWQADVPNGGWGWKQLYTPDQQAQLSRAYEDIFLKILPKAVADLDPQRLYWPSSPQAAWDRHADLSAAKQSGDIHYWDVWWGQKPFADYRTHIGRFMSEYGFQSFPEFRTVQAYAVPADYDIFSDVMKAHQRSSIGNGTIKTYMERDYKVPADFRQFLYVGQVLQAEGIKVAMEAHRSRMSYCMGSLFWQINDCWPVASWSSIDYFGRWKAQQYFAVKAFDAVLVSPVIEGDKVSVTLVSDLRADRDVTLDLTVMDFHGKVITHKSQMGTLKANTSARAFDAGVADLLGGAAPDSVLLHVTLSDADTQLAENILYFAPVKALPLPKPDLHTQVKTVGAGIAVGLTASVLVKNICLDAGHDGRFSDNYFDLLPGETRVVTFTPRKPVSAAAFKSALQVMHMAQAV